jgi:hypothetical protein
MLVGGVVNQDQALGEIFTTEATAKVGHKSSSVITSIEILKVLLRPP